MKNWLFFIFSFISFQVSANEFSANLSFIVDSIKSRNVTRSLSWSEPLANNRLLYDQLKMQASINDLLFLTGYQDDLVKILSFHALCERQLLSALEVAESSLMCRTTTEYSKGCYQDYKYIADIFISIAWKYTDTSDDQIVLAKQNDLNDTLLNIALVDDRHLYTVSSLLLNASANPAYYNRIRRLALFRRTPEAFIALAQYKKQQDIGLFISLLNKDRTDRLTALDAISNFPDSIFFPYLVNAYYRTKDEKYRSERLQILRTIALYGNVASINFFEQVFESNKVGKSKKKKAVLYDLYSILAEQNNPIYNSLQEDIKNVI